MWRAFAAVIVIILCGAPCRAAVSGWTAFGNARLAGGCAVLENGEAGSQAGIECSVPVADGYIRAYRLRGLFEASAEEKGDLWLYCDIYYRDGAHTWGPWVPIDKTGVCRRTLDIIPTRPVRSIYCLVIFRNSRGRAVVKDVSLEPLDPAPGPFVCRQTEKGYEVMTRTALPCRMVLETGGESAASEGTDHFFVLPEREAVLYVNGVCRGKRRFAPQTGTEVWAESGFARVFPNTPPGRKSIALCAPRGGRVSFQLCARSVKPEDLALKAGAFTSERGKIGPGCISLRHNRYIWLDRPSDTVIRDGEHLIASEIPCEGPLPGLWADVLVPCDRLRMSPDRTEALWADIRVPEDAPPGLYRGRIFAGSGAVSVSLRVYPVRLPEGGGLKCSFSFVESLARKVMGKDFSPRKAAEFLRSCGLDYHDAGSTGTETGYHASSFVLTNAAEEEDGLYTLYNPPGAYDASFLRRFAQRLEKPYAFFLERGMADKAYVYGFDERGPEYYGAIKKTFGMVHSRFPGLKTLSTAVIPPEICPFDMGIDAYVALDGRLSRKQMKMQKEKGGEYWWYVCGNRRFAVENTLISDRLLFWQTKREGLDGFFYWALNFWDKEDNSPLEQERSEYVFDISGGPCHGDGRLLYPGENGAILSSPRFEQILLGLEDHRLLSLYEEKYGAKKTRALIDSLCPGTGAYHTDPGAFDKARRQLLEGLGNKEKL